MTERPPLFRHHLAPFFVVALAASFAQFGAVAALNDVAHHFGSVGTSGSLTSQVGLSGSELGMGLAVLRLASLFALPLTALADRTGRTSVLRRTLGAGLILTALASLSFSFWSFVLCFALARPLLTSASTLVQVITIESVSARERVHALSVVAAGAGVGAGLAALAHGVVRGTGSFRWLFAFALVVWALVAPFARRVVEPGRRRDDATPLARLGVIAQPWRERLVSLAVITFGIGMVTGPGNGFAFVYAEGVLRLNPRAVAVVILASALGGLGGLVAGRSLANRWGRRRTVGIGFVVLAVMSSVAYVGGRTPFVVGYLGAIAAAGLLAPAMSALSTEVFDQVHRATAAGWLVVAGVLGATSGLLWFGVVSDHVRAHGTDALRLAALVTFLPFLLSLPLLRRVPEHARRALG